MNLLFRLMFALGLICFCSGANAQEKNDAQLCIGIICDTAQQVERYVVNVYRDAMSPQAALEVVNTGVKNPKACRIAAIAFIPDEQIGIVNTSIGSVRVWRIMVIATGTESGWRQVPVTLQYTARFEKIVEANALTDRPAVGNRPNEQPKEQLTSLNRGQP